MYIIMINVVATGSSANFKNPLKVKESSLREICNADTAFLPNGADIF